MSDEMLRQLALLPDRLGWHMLLTVTALGAGIAISIPLAILAFRWRRIQGPVLGAASVIQTIPSLALLALMVVLLRGQIGFVPAILALILYSMLPILRNTVTGLTGVDPALVEAARGMGMTDNQMLFRVQLPLAAPVIIAGIRTATVWVVGITVLATPVGQVSLGNYIFQGLQLGNNVAISVGIVAAAALALGLDGLIRLIELAASRRNAPLALGISAALLLIIGCGSIAPIRNHFRADTIIGTKTFTEQYILAEILDQRLIDAGFLVRKTEGMGSTILFKALAYNAVDCYVDYTGTIWATIMKRTDTPGPQQVLEEMTEFLERSYGIVTIGRLGFENAYALAMRRDLAEQLGIRTIADLARHAPGMTIGGDYEFFGRPEWVNVRDAYGLRFQRTVSLDSTLMYAAVRDEQVDVITAFSSDGRILAFDLVVLEDTRHAFPPYDAVILVSSHAARRPGLIEALQPLVDSIDDDLMRQMNKTVDLDKESPAQAAELHPLSPQHSDAHNMLSPEY